VSACGRNRTRMGREVRLGVGEAEVLAVGRECDWPGTEDAVVDRHPGRDAPRVAIVVEQHRLDLLFTALAGREEQAVLAVPDRLLDVVLVGCLDRVDLPSPLSEVVDVHVL